MLRLEIPEFKPLSEESSSSQKASLLLDDILFDELNKVLRKTEQPKLSESSLISPELLLSTRVSRLSFEKALTSIVFVIDIFFSFSDILISCMLDP